MASRPVRTFLIKSCVIGRGVLTFSISSAMALASYTPTQIGSTVSLPTSLSNTIGMFETGSIISPRIFISTSIRTSKPADGAPGVPARLGFPCAPLCPLWLKLFPFLPQLRCGASRCTFLGTTTITRRVHHLSRQAVREASRHAHLHVPASLKLHAVRHREVHHLNLRRPPDPLCAGRVLPFYHDLEHLPNVPLIALGSDLFLPVIQYGQPPSLLRIRDPVIQPQRRSVRPRRILERKYAVIPNFVHQAERLFKFPLR